jgi:hypothetical protein
LPASQCWAHLSISESEETASSQHRRSAGAWSAARGRESGTPYLAPEPWVTPAALLVVTGPERLSRVLVMGECCSVVVW